MKPERFTEEPGELDEESLGRLLEVKVSQGTDVASIQKNIELGIFLRFFVTKEFDVYVATGSQKHEAILENNGVQWSDCMLTNGVLKEANDGSLEFIYHSTSKSPLQSAVEKKLLAFLSVKVGFKLGNNSVRSIYSTD